MHIIESLPFLFNCTIKRHNGMLYLTDSLIYLLHANDKINRKCIAFRLI